MCSEDVSLAVLHSCGTNVPGMWVSGGALLRSVEEQLRLHFKSTVRRAAPCTMSCCPPWHAYSPGAGTHHCTLARTLGLSGCVHSRAHIWDRLVLLVFRAQVGSEATGPILLADNAISVRKIRPGADCFAALDVLPVAPLRERVLMGPAAGGSRALLLLPTAGPASPYHGLSWCTRIRCKGVFPARARAISA